MSVPEGSTSFENRTSRIALYIHLGVGLSGDLRPRRRAPPVYNETGEGRFSGFFDPARKTGSILKGWICSARERPPW